MAKGLLQLLLFTVLISSSFAQTNNVEIAEVISTIEKESVISYITHLENFNTRFMLAPTRFAVADWIKGEFEKMGFLNVELDSFECATVIDLPPRGRHIDTTTTQVNVIATLPGYETPEEIYIICGHYDCFVDDASAFTYAPGADDNASGTTAVLESARAIMESGYQPKSTLRFIAFAAEELMNFGDAGSEHYANMAAARGDDIKLVINNDMIGHSAPNTAFETVSIGHQDYSGIGSVAYYVSTFSNLEVNTAGYFGADLRTFTALGYDGIYFEEYVFNTENYHKTTDTIFNLYTNYCTEVIKASCATLLGMQNQPTETIEYEIPRGYSLMQNYPNPFNPSTKIIYQIPEGGHVALKVYDCLGREIANLVKEFKTAGTHEALFDAGSNIASGTYFYTININGWSENKKMILLR